MTADSLVLCRLEDIEDGEGKGFTLTRDGARQEIFVVRDGAQVYGYRNLCPHAGSALDWQPDRFMNGDGSYVMCHTHGALFRIEDGYCVAGPCAGKSLTPVPVALDAAGGIRLAMKEQEPSAG